MQPFANKSATSTPSALSASHERRIPLDQLFIFSAASAMRFSTTILVFTFGRRSSQFTVGRCVFDTTTEHQS
jgi:hypothetical protein